jgi:ribosomal protein S18 acetylase RimI-like enzyme
MHTELKEVLDDKGLKAFIHFPFDLFKENPYWIPPLNFDEFNTLNKQKNPAFDYCEARLWLAYQNNKIVGRVAAIINHKHIKKWEQPYIRFGWLDFIDDEDVSGALIGAVEGWAKERGLTAVHGPLGFCDMDREGMLVEGFNEMSTMITNYNFPYYPQHLDKLGYIKDTDWVEYEISMPTVVDERIHKAAEIVQKRGNLHLLKVKSKKELLSYAKEIFQVYDEAYKRLYGFVPLTEKQVDGYIDQYFGFISPEFVPIVLDQNNKVVGFGITMPSLARALQKANGELFPFGFLHILKAMQKNDRADLYLIGVKDEYQGAGVNAMIMDSVIQVFQQKGIVRVESNPELEDNLMVRTQWKYFETRQHKRRRVFIKSLIPQ